MDIEESVITLYEDVLQHRRHAFPPYFFVGAEGKKYAAVILRYVIEEKLVWNRSDISLYLSREVLAKYRLAGMLKTYFQYSVFLALDNAYPGEFQPWELLKARKRVFCGETGRKTACDAIRWMIVDKLKYTSDELHQISCATFEDYHLDEMLHTIYNGSPWRALNDAGYYISRPWETKHTPNGYWKGEFGRNRAIEAVRWLIEEKLNLPIDEIPSIIRFHHFKDNGLGNMIQSVFNGSTYEAIEALYPGRFKRWQYGSVGNGYWQGEEGLIHVKEALRWLIHEQLKIRIEDAPLILKEEVFKQHGLGSMFANVLGRSTRRALDLIDVKLSTQEIHRVKRVYRNTISTT